MKTKKPTPGFWLIFIGVSFIIYLLVFAISSQFPHPFDEEIPRDEFAFLPPKVFSEAGGFLDGVGWAEDVLLDPKTKLPSPDFQKSSRHYETSAIRSPIETHSVFVDELTPLVKAYGSGGDVSLGIMMGEMRSSLYSPSFRFESDLIDSLQLRIGELGSDSPAWSLHLKVDVQGDKSFSLDIPLLPYSRRDGDFTLDKSLITASLSAASSLFRSGKSSFLAKFEIAIRDQKSPSSPFFISSFNVETSARVEPSDLDPVNWTDASRMLSLGDWTVSDGAILGIRGSRLLCGCFSYDYYAGLFGLEDSGFQKTVFSRQEIDDFIAKGWMQYTWQDDLSSSNVGAFAILDTLHCPIREAIQEIHERNDSLLSSGLSGWGSPYRYFFYQGYLPDCTPPRYFFGTDGEGRNYQKRLSRGLLISLSLALSIGLISSLFGAYVIRFFRGIPHPVETPFSEEFFPFWGLFLFLFWISSAFMAMTFVVRLYWLFFLGGSLRALRREKNLLKRPSFFPLCLVRKDYPQKKSFPLIGSHLGISLFIGEELLAETIGFFFVVFFPGLSWGGGIGSFLMETQGYWPSFPCPFVATLGVFLVAIISILFLYFGFRKRRVTYFYK